MRETGREPIVIGFDTSNYRTSVAAVTLEGEILVNHRELLPVPKGERGLRQSEAVFAHIRQLRSCEDLLRKAAEHYEPAAVAASTKPRDGEASYMPVFQAGHTAGLILAAANGIPFYGTTHQRGHLAAALQGSGLQVDSFLAVHLSGGTTDLIAVDGESLTQIGGSADLHAGQLVDRAGVAMGLVFPSGEALEKLAECGKSEARLGCSVEEGGLVCHLSGAETRIRDWLREGTLSHEDIAAEIYDLLARTLIRMLRAGTARTGMRQALITGGVASSALLRRMLQERKSKVRDCPELFFGQPEMSGDNAVGVALTGVKRLKQETRQAAADRCDE